MFRLIILSLLAILFIIFASQNMETVLVRFVFGPAIKVPLVLMVLMSFLAGVVVTTLMNLMKRIRERKIQKDEEEE